MGADDKSDDGELIRRALNGDEIAFDALHEKYRTRLFLYVLKEIRNSEDADEIVNDAFVKIFRHVGNLRSSEKLLNWMYRIAHQCIDAWRRKNRSRLKYTEEADSAKVLNALIKEACANYQEAQQREASGHRVEMSLSALSQIPESQRRVMLLHYVDNMSHRAIAQSLGITGAAVNSRLQRARENVKRLVREAEDDEHY